MKDNLRGIFMKIAGQDLSISSSRNHSRNIRR